MQFVSVIGDVIELSEVANNGRTADDAADHGEDDPRAQRRDRWLQQQISDDDRPEENAVCEGVGRDLGEKNRGNESDYLTTDRECLAQFIRWPCSKQIEDR